MDLSGKVAIVGVGMTEQGNLPGSTAMGLGVEAFRRALDDAGLKKKEIDGLLTFPGTTSPEQASHYLAFGETVGVDPVFTLSANLGGATVGGLIHIGAMAIATGAATYVACVFGDAAKTGGSRFDTVRGGDDPWSIWGMISPAANSALGARRHMALYGTKQEHLGEIAVTLRHHARLNPDALMREPMTLADHAASRPIIKPLNLFDCCLICDGGVAIILGPAERARDLRHPPVLIAGLGQGHTTQNLGTRDWWYNPHQHDAVSRAYRMAKMGPSDVGFAQLYDNFTIAVLFWLEHAGFCGVGESGPFVEGGARVRVGGELPLNTSGGSLSETYLQGWNLYVEAVRQMRGGCGERQVGNAEVCMITGRGMALNTAAVTILKKA